MQHQISETEPGLTTNAWKQSDGKKQQVIWEMIRKIADKHQTIPIKHLSKDNSIITDIIKTITELLAETFSKNSSKQNGKKEFITIKEDAEKHKLNFKSKKSRRV